MNLKKAVIASAAAALLVGSAMNVSAAEKTPSNYVNALKANNQENLIIDVEAYKAAYSDLAEAFGDDTDAYIRHYLTIGVYEGRTKGVLFDPLVYAEAYSDVKEAFGYNIPAIVNHYLTFGISENRTQGTAAGYADLAAAERAGAQKTNIQRNVIVINDFDSNATGSSYGNSVVGNNNNAAAGIGSNALINGNNVVVNGNNIVNATNGAAAGIDNTALNNGNNTAAGNSSTPVNSNAATGSNSANSSNATANSGNNTTADNSATASNSNNVSSNKNYHHTTSIYNDDKSALIRVEYYDDQNKLIQYSDVTNYDSSTNSYTEEIYHYDEENQTEVLDRTDTYVNGALSSSETH